jgi:PadR family transcriptional regulator PadR
MIELNHGHVQLLLLAALSSGPMHGYRVIAALTDRSGGAVELPEGTIYPALHKLERDGLIQSDWEAVDGRRRRVYAITVPGRSALASQSAQWQRFSDGVSDILAWAH